MPSTSGRSLASLAMALAVVASIKSSDEPEREDVTGGKGYSPEVLSSKHYDEPTPIPAEQEDSPYDNRPAWVQMNDPKRKGPHRSPKKKRRG